MPISRAAIDKLYDLLAPTLFKLTEKDPEVAHHAFVRASQLAHAIGLDHLLLDPKNQPSVEISNAAGFNKNGDIPPRVLQNLGFNRVVVGTVTALPYDGNPRPRIQRFPETGSIVNWMGLPGDGVYEVAEQLIKYRNHSVPLTINLMATPGLTGRDVIDDISVTVAGTRNKPGVDRYELNISCPNTHSSSGSLDARAENLRQLDAMVERVMIVKKDHQQVYLKVSPDSSEKDVDDTLEVARKYGVMGITTANTTTRHNPHQIPESPGKGGASGEAVYHSSLRVQQMYHEKAPDLKLIACGGINTLERMQERINAGATGIQVFTPLIFKGPKLLTELNHYLPAEPK